jgi:hypothetical protein
VAEGRPRHDLKQAPVDFIAWNGKVTVVGYRRGAIQMELIIIMSRPKNVQEFRECVAALRKPRVVRRQIARYDIGTCAHDTMSDTGADRTKVISASEIAGKIDACGVLVEKRIAGIIVLGNWICRVASVAISLPVDDIAAYSHEIVVQPFKVELETDGQGSISELDARIRAGGIGVYSLREQERSRWNNESKSSKGSKGLSKL